MKLATSILFLLITQSYFFNIYFKIGDNKSRVKSTIEIEDKVCYSNTKTSKTSEVFNPHTFLITFAGTEIIYNNHVGNEWVSYCKINGKKLYYKEKITINMEFRSSVSIVSFLHETEEKYNDSATKEVYVTKSELSKYRGSEYHVIVTIRESNGRYAGNKAQMKFKYQVE